MKLLNAVVALAFAQAVFPGVAAESGETFFGVDSAAAWLARPGFFKTPTGEKDLFRYTVGKIAETGFRQARERLSWQEVNPRPDEWKPDHYLKVYSLYRKKGIRVSGMFHDAPDWTFPKGKLPTDLKAVYDFAKRLGETFGDLVDDWEFWNEEDIGFCEASAWDYVAAAKAAYLGFKDAHPDRPALMGALCKPSRSAYDRTLFANDLGLYTDAMNFHVYATRAEYSAVFGELKRFLSDYGLDDRAIWVTESGTHEEGLCEKDGAMPGQRAHSPEQELQQASIAAESQMLLMMAGVSRDYFFCFPPYNEMGGKKDWGMMRRDGGLKPVAAVFAEMIRRLGKAELLGEVAAPDGGRAYAFRQRNGSHTVCTVGKGLPTYRDGVTDVKVLKPAAKRGVLGARPQAADEDRRLVLQLKTDENDFKLGGGKSSVELTGESGRVTVVVYNFEGKEKTGVIEAEGARIDGLPATVTVPAWGKVEIAGVYRPSEKESLERLVLRGRFGGRTSSRLVANVTNPAMLRKSCLELPLDIGDEARWEKNDSSDAYETSWDPKEGARRFHLSWKKNVDRWAYPRYRLKPGELDGALMLEFEIRSAQDKVENDFVTENVMLFSKGPTRQIGFAAPLGTWERRTIDLSAERGLAEATALSIGLNPAGHDLTYWIRNVRLYKTRPQGFYSVAERDGRWVALDPDGQPFTLLGVDHVRPDGHMCEALGYAPYGRFVETNYPSREAWAEETVARLKGWGFNALGAGCEFKELQNRGLVRTVFLSMGESVCYGDRALWISKCLSAPGTAFPNVFHPGFAEACERIAAKTCAATRDDRTVFGYFIDNELAWRGEGLFDAVMERPDGDCAKQALLAWMKGRPVTSELKLEFLGLCAERYFAITTSAIRRHDPNHLVLGCRFAGIGQEDQVWRAAAKHCDVLTFNHYPWADLDRNVVLTQKGGVRVTEVYGALYEKVKRPLLITEWSFPATDADVPSRYGTGQRFETQELRVQATELFAKTLLALPYFIGYDYFMWVDEPPLGIARHFPEDSNYGLVNNAGRPYGKLTRMFAALHRDVAKWRKAGVPSERKAPANAKPVFERDRFLSAVRGSPEAVRFERTANGWRLSNDVGLVLSGGTGGDMVADVARGTRHFGTCGALLDAIGAAGHRWIDARDAQTFSFSRNGACGTVTVRAEGGDGSGRFALTVRFTVAPGRGDFLCEFVSVENVGTTPWNVQGLFFRPFAVGRPKEAVPSVPFLWKGRLESGWRFDDGATYTLVSGDPDVIEFRAWMDDQGVQHPDMRFVPPEPLVLKPGKTYRPPRPFSALARPGDPAVRTPDGTFALGGENGSVRMIDFGPDATAGYPVLEIASVSGHAKVRLSYACVPEFGAGGDFTRETSARYLGPAVDLPILPANINRFDVFDVPKAGTYSSSLQQGLVRYVRVQLETPGTEVTVKDVRFENRGTHSTEPVVGSFRCSDPALTALWRASVRTCTLAAIPARTKPLRLKTPETNVVLGTTYAYLSDGAKRDRLVWSGDLWWAQPNMYAAFAPDSPYMPGSLRMLAENQTPEGYVQACPYPESHGPVRDGDYGPFQSDEFAAWFVPVLAAHYLHTGDLGLVRELYPNVRRLMGYLGKHRRADGIFEQRPATSKHANDLAFGASSTHHRSLMNVLLWRTYRDAARLAEATGRADEAASWSREARILAAAVRARFFRDDGLLVNSLEDTQSGNEANALALGLGFFTADEAKAVLAKVPRIGHGKFQQQLVRGAFAYGDPDEAVRRIRQHNWLKMVDPGWAGVHATTECMNHPTHADWGDECHPDTALAGDLTSGILGVAPTAPGYARIRFRPGAASGLDWAEGTVPTPKGDVVASWRRVGGRIERRIKAPDGIVVED